MSEANIKNELLKQNGKSAVDQETSRLHAIIAAEQRRVRRLLFLTIGVWAVWILMIALSVGIPMILAHASPPHASIPPVATAVSARPTPGIAGALFGGIIGILVIAGFIGLPIAGIVLAIMLIVSRHTASVNQVRASLASIDAQLRNLGAAGVKSE